MSERLGGRILAPLFLPVTPPMHARGPLLDGGPYVLGVGEENERVSHALQGYPPPLLRRLYSTPILPSKEPYIGS